MDYKHDSPDNLFHLEARLSNKPIPLKTLKALIEAQYCYIVLIDAALRDIPELPAEPYRKAFLLAGEQYSTLVSMHIKRTNEDKTQRLLDDIKKRTEVINVEAPQA